jgi:hypothetical protein
MAPQRANPLSRDLNASPRWVSIASMRARLSLLLSRSAFLVGAVAFLLAVVVQSGELGSSDTMHRLQAAHSFWTSEPAVFPNEYPEFGLHGRGGKLYGWYGIGQSLLLLPFDIAGSYMEHLPILSAYAGSDPTVRNILVTYCVNILLSVLTALVCFRFLRLLEFTVNQAIAGVLALLFCTTHLHYTQNMMENNYILLLTLTGLTFQYDWLRSRRRQALLIGSAALGLNLLTRLTTMMDLLAVAVFLLLVLWSAGVRGRELLKHSIAYLKVAVPVYGFFLVLDRVYQFCRFGSFFNTYIQVYARERRLLDPTLPTNYPFETPFHVGFLGALFQPEKSIFLFDPLLVLTIIVSVLLWKRFRPEIKAYIAAAGLLVLAYISFYARYTVWSGDFAWGDRYVSTSAELVAFISVPLLLRHRMHVGGFMRGIALAFVVGSAIIQLASVALWMPLEIYQMETLGHPTFVIALRFKNIVAFALGKMQAGGLTSYAMNWDDWDYVHITTWNFLPFILKRVGQAPPWVVKTATSLWIAAITGLILLLAAIWRKATRGEFEIESGPSRAACEAAAASLTT